MNALKRIFFFAAAVFFFISCDIEPGDEGNTGIVKPDIDIPGPGDLPDFTPEMGIPVSDSTEARNLWVSIMNYKVSAHDSIFTASTFQTIDHIFSIIRRRNDWKDNIEPGEYDLVDETPLNFYVHLPEGTYTHMENFDEISCKTVYYNDLQHVFSGITVYKGSLTNLYFIRRNDVWSKQERCAHAWLVSAGGFCAKIVIDYFSAYDDNDSSGSGILRIYGADDQEIYKVEMNKAQVDTIISY